MDEIIYPRPKKSTGVETTQNPDITVSKLGSWSGTGKIIIKVDVTIESSPAGDAQTGSYGASGIGMGSSQTPPTVGGGYALGYVPAPEEPTLFERETLAQQRYEDQKVTESLPAVTRFDYRNYQGNDFVGTVRDQGHCGSCVAFGVVAAAETTLRVRHNDAKKAVDLSEAHLFFCLGAQKGRTCGNTGEANGGWWPSGALSEFRDVGVADEGCSPYPAPVELPRDARTPPCHCCADWGSRVTKIKAYSILSQPSEMKNYLAGGKGALVACFSVYDDFQPFFAGNPLGIYRKSAQSKPLGGHCICVIGYNDEDGGYWVCKNSWSHLWADHGFFKIGYGEVGIDAYMWSLDFGT